MSEPRFVTQELVPHIRMARKTCIVLLVEIFRITITLDRYTKA